MVKCLKIRLDSGCVLKERKLVGDGLSVEVGERKKKKDSIQVLKCSPVEMTLFLGGGEMWSRTGVGDLLVIPP